MLKPTCEFVYVFQVVSVTDEGACVELSAVLGDGVADGDGDCVLPASELQDANRIAKMRKMYCFLIKTPLEVFLAAFLPSITQHIFLRSYQDMGIPNLAVPIFENFKPCLLSPLSDLLRSRMIMIGA